MMVSRGLRDPITPPMIILSIQTLFQSLGATAPKWHLVGHKG